MEKCSTFHMHHEPTKVIKVSFKWSCLSFWVNLKRKLNFTFSQNSYKKQPHRTEINFPITLFVPASTLTLFDFVRSPLHPPLSPHILHRRSRCCYCCCNHYHHWCWLLRRAADDMKYHSPPECCWSREALVLPWISSVLCLQ